MSDRPDQEPLTDTTTEGRRVSIPVGQLRRWHFPIIGAAHMLQGVQCPENAAELTRIAQEMTETEDAPATAAELPPLPEPDQWTLEDGHAIPFWSAGLGVTAWRGGVEIGDGDFREDLDAVEHDALATLAAVRYARRFAAQGEDEACDG